MSIIIRSFLSKDSIAKIEKLRSAKYICDTEIKNSSGSWRESPSAIFYCEEAHQKGSNWFALSMVLENAYPARYVWTVSDGISATEPFDGVVARNGDIIYSSYVHDFVTSPDGSVSVDGGRFYTKMMWGDDNNQPSKVKLQIIKDKLVVVGPTLVQETMPLAA